MATTTTAQIEPALQTYYDRVLLQRAVPWLIHEVAAQSRPLKARSGNQIKFRRYEALALATTPLTEGQAPSGSQMSKTDITATVSQYGDFVEITDVVDLTNQDPVLTEAGELLGEQMGQTRDALVRDVLAACASVVDFANGALPGNEDKLNLAIKTLLGNNAKEVTKLIRPSQGFNTTPVPPAYYAFSHTDLFDDWEATAGWVPIQKYPKPEEAHEAEIGAYKKIRVLQSSQGQKTSGSPDTYKIPVVGQNAYGVTELVGGGAANIIKGFGSAGTADPLNQKATSGWKMFHVATILNDNFMIVLSNVAHS